MKNIKEEVNRREIKKNRINDKFQLHRRMPRYMLGRLNRWMCRRIQRFIDYKARWKDVPLGYVSAHNNSKVCPRCGGIMEPSSDWHTGSCGCGLVANRHWVACVNIANKAENEGLWFGPDWRVMEPLCEVSPSVGLSQLTQQNLF